MKKKTRHFNGKQEVLHEIWRRKQGKTEKRESCIRRQLLTMNQVIPYVERVRQNMREKK